MTQRQSGRCWTRPSLSRSPLVYAQPTNRAPHGAFRNVASGIAHITARLAGGGDLRHFHSFRLVLGEVGRGLAAYCGERHPP